MRLRSELLVEGREDREVIYQLCNVHGVDNRRLFNVVDTDGYDNLRDGIPIRAKTGLDVLGAVIDADLSPTDRWASICGALTRAGYQDLPVEPVPGGYVSDPPARLPRIGIWMMPSNKDAGILEDFLAELIADDDELIGPARASVGALPTPRRFADVATSKAELHTWLAWQADPGTPTGQALVKHYLDPAHPVAEAFVRWLQRLFLEPV